jgi:formate hydrogenlyase subunit 3/multisubunit Na+/H+ antiporter MnhD subunit
MKLHLDRIGPAVALILGVVLMAVLVLSDEYTHAAGAEARGYHALFAVGGAR